MIDTIAVQIQRFQHLKPKGLASGPASYLAAVDRKQHGFGNYNILQCVQTGTAQTFLICVFKSD